MNAFISYSHADSTMLEMLHKHLATLKREGVLSTWTDQQIEVGQNLERKIDNALNNSSLFLALISPDYISSNYCYEIEFQQALKMQEDEKLIIVPIIIEPCDWHNTPFKNLKAVPKDGKPVSSWDNKNTAFLDVVQNLRKLILSEKDIEVTANTSILIKSSRNYKIQKDFDSIEKIEHTEKTFSEVKAYIIRYIDEIKQIDNIRTRIVNDTSTEFSCIVVNRNKMETEAHIKIFIGSGKSSFSSFGGNAQKQISYSIDKSETTNHSQLNSFMLSFDEYHLYWTQNDIYSSGKTKNEFLSIDIADKIWNESLESIGIM